MITKMRTLLTTYRVLVVDPDPLAGNIGWGYKVLSNGPEGSWIEGVGSRFETKAEARRAGLEKIFAIGSAS